MRLTRAAITRSQRQRRRRWLLAGGAAVEVGCGCRFIGSYRSSCDSSPPQCRYVLQWPNHTPGVDTVHTPNHCEYKRSEALKARQGECLQLQAPSTRIILHLAVLKRRAFGPRYSSELYQRLACSRLGNSRTTTRLGCQSPSRLSAAPPRTM